MRFSDAGLCRRQTKLLYTIHRLPPWSAEDATRDRSNRLLGHGVGISQVFPPKAPPQNCGDQQYYKRGRGKRHFVPEFVAADCHAQTINPNLSVSQNHVHSQNVAR
jgi:hypothetical protein